MAWPQGSDAFARGACSFMALASEWTEYLTDLAQRQVLTTDVLRRRGNQYVEHTVLGRPPVLTFQYELVRDGRSLPRPVNYQLLRIPPDPDHPTDQTKRPMVIVDPRAGHGPGIGGFKTDSQVGLALKNGYPCYFVSFLPEPVPGQTIEDVARAEAAFLEEIIKAHPQAEDRPVVIGNCQAGWAVAILSAVEPELMSVIILNGAPLSYWSGDVGRNPMRYLGGVLGGSWLAALSSDMDNGRFDGANLVSNFEFLDPANTLWKKPYNLFANIDTEAERFLEFERWWGGYFLLNKSEICSIVEELFIGNRLSSGDISGKGGQHVELRAIKAPIVVFCSRGDNITPPQQALNWILDVYESVDDIRANNQVIVYLVHESIGHLGIFVSAKIAKREHRAIVDSLDVVSTLPPGLYEMEVGDKGEVAFAKRDLDDIRALGGTRREEPYFLPVARVSAVNKQVYDTFVSPWVRLFANEAAAEIRRRSNPTRVRRYAWSELNPLMAGVEVMAGQVRAQRTSAGKDNLFRRAEAQAGELIVGWLDHFRDWRDQAMEEMFFALYMPLRAMSLREEQAALDTRAGLRERRHRAARDQLAARIRKGLREGGVDGAVLRIVLYLARRSPRLDAGRFRLAEAALQKSDAFAGMNPRRFRQAVRDQFHVLMDDPEAAIAAIPAMVPGEDERKRVMAIVDGAVTAIGTLDSGQQADLERVRGMLAGTAARAGDAMSPDMAAAKSQKGGTSDKPSTLH